MQTEIAIEELLLIGFGDVERRIEESLRHDRLMKGLYDPELVVYSTAVPAVANRMDLIAASSEFALASVLASVSRLLFCAVIGRFKTSHEWALFTGRVVMC